MQSLLKRHKQGQYVAKDKTCNECNKIGHFANKCTSSNRSYGQGHRYKGCCKGNQLHQSDHNKVQKHPPQVRAHIIHECNRMYWCGRDWHSWWQFWQHTLASLHRCQIQPSHQADHLQGQRHKNSNTQHTTKTKITSLHRYQKTKGNSTGPNLDVSKVSANVMPISLFRRLYPALYESTGKALENFNSDLTSLTAYGGATIQQFGISTIKRSGIFIWKISQSQCEIITLWMHMAQHC